MSAIAFIDTSVLCNLVPVPGRDQRKAEVALEMKSRLDSGERFILPITAVIETGNFIGQLADGRERRATAIKFDLILRYVCNGDAPWILHDVAWNRSFLEQFLDGAGTGASYVDHAQNRVGAGDLCILTEREHYQNRSRIPAGVWTLDTALGAHS
jgi:hypothetical protein